MLTYSQPKLEIVHCDNGYVIEWRDERRRSEAWATDRSPPVAGVKIFATKKEVIKYLETFFAGS